MKKNFVDKIYSKLDELYLLNYKENGDKYKFANQSRSLLEEAFEHLAKNFDSTLTGWKPLAEYMRVFYENCPPPARFKWGMPAGICAILYPG